MERTRLQPGQTHLAQPFPDGPLVDIDGVTPGDLRAEINATPADHTVLRQIGALQDRCLQLRHLRLAQQRRLARTMARFQARDPHTVIPMSL